MSHGVTISVKISFPSLDRRIVAFHQGHDGDEASTADLQYFVRNEVEHALEFLASDYHRMSPEGKATPTRRRRQP